MPTSLPSGRFLKQSMVEDMRQPNAKAVLWRACVLVAINMSLNNNIPRVNGPKVTLENAKIALINVNWKIKRKLRLIKFARTIVFILKTG